MGGPFHGFNNTPENLERLLRGVEGALDSLELDRAYGPSPGGYSGRESSSDYHSPSESSKKHKPSKHHKHK